LFLDKKETNGFKEWVLLRRVLRELSKGNSLFLVVIGMDSNFRIYRHPLGRTFRSDR